MNRENPHDRFAKTVMSKTENAKDFFHGVLPEGLKRFIDMETLRQEPPMVLPVVLYHGRKKWKKKKLFRRTEVKIWLLLQKYIYEADKLLRHLNSILGIDILYFRDEEGLRFLRTALLYIEFGSGLTITEVNKAMEHTDPIIREEYMTLYEQTIQVGKITDKQDVLIRLLSKKFGLTEKEKAYIKGIEDAGILEKGLDEILFAETKDQVLAVLH